MKAFSSLKSVAIPLGLDNVDTDQILPARYLSVRREDGYGDFCFRDIRLLPDETERLDCVLNKTEYRHGRILVAGANFGCGSSREGAVYALQDSGIGLVIAESFGDIFHQNALINGLLPVKLRRDEIQDLLGILQAQPGMEVDVILESQRVLLPNHPGYGFAIDPFRKHCLQAGLDEVDFTRSFVSEIEIYESKMQNRIFRL